MKKTMILVLILVAVILCEFANRSPEEKQKQARLMMYRATPAANIKTQ